MRHLGVVIVVVMVLALVPRPALAQGYFAPSYGFDFGGDAGNCPSFLNNCSEKRTTYGFAAGFLSHGMFGLEEDLSYAPDFFGRSPSFGSNSVLTLMSNIVIAIPAGPVHPYVSGGVGLIRTNVDSFGSFLSLSHSTFGYDLGGGLMVMLPAHLGVRIDYRHLQATGDTTFAGLTLLKGTKLSFSRIMFGLVLH